MDCGPRQKRRLSASVCLIALCSIALLAKAANGAATVPQCAFNPSGYLYPKASLPAAFSDLDHLTLWEYPIAPDGNNRPGLYGRHGETYEFENVNRIAPFEFTTRRINDTSYTFTGRFHMVCSFEEEVRKHADEVFLEGELTKLQNGQKIAGTQVEFLYSPTLRAVKKDVNDLYPSGKTELTYAVLEGNAAKVRALLAAAANPSIRDWEGRTVLMYAIKFLNAKEARPIVKLLLAAHADVNLKDHLGMTALMWACFVFDDRDGALVKSLLAAGADANASDNYGTTVLMHSVGGATQKADLVKNVKALIRAGARVDGRNSFGKTALSFAEEEENTAIINLLKRAGAK